MPGKSLMRSLGEFCRHVASGFTTSLPEGPVARREVRRSTDQASHRSPEGVVTLRRTTIEEIELRPGEAGPTDPAPRAPRSEG